MSEAKQILQYTLDGESRIEQSINLLRKYEPPEGYYLAFSGGKDSIVIYDLAKKAGVRFDPHFSRTTVDPPEILDFIKKNYPDVIWEKPKKSMFQLIRETGCLPTRFKRFCCRALKEIGGRGRIVIVGTRAEESFKRKNRAIYHESKRTKGKFLLQPILYWTTEDIWDYIENEELPYCTLYNQGYNRIGCIMCPLQSKKGMEMDAKRFPKYYKAYMNTIHFLRSQGKYQDFDSDQEVMDWWMQKIPTVKRRFDIKNESVGIEKGERIRRM
jgi:phosphoadenosine phosphosulfate reductase